MGVSAVIPRPHHRHPRESGDPWLTAMGVSAVIPRTHHRHFLPVASLVSPLLSHDSPVRPGSKKSADVLLAVSHGSVCRHSTPPPPSFPPGGKPGVASSESRLPSKARQQEIG